MKSTAIRCCAVAILVTVGIQSSVIADKASASSKSPKVAKVFEAPPIEWVPAASKLVGETDEAERKEVSRKVMETFRDKQPMLMPSLVGHLAKKDPDLAPFYALTAAELTPEFAVDIARAATASAPEQSAEIGSGVAAVFAEKEARRLTLNTPEKNKAAKAADVRGESAALVFVAVSEEAPAALRSEVAAAIETSVPELRQYATTGPGKSNGKGKAEGKIGVGNGKGQGGDNGLGTAKPLPGRGNAVGRGIGNGKGRGTVNGRGVLNAYDRVGD